MSGTRLHSMREGDRSEYFAQVLLSGLGLVTPIPRQEDIGFDFFCNISDQETGILTFGAPFLISIKSLSAPNIELMPTETAIVEKNQHHITWLFKPNMPTFLGVVDKKAFRMSIYSLLPIWFLFYEGGPRCGAMIVKPRIDPQICGDVGKPEEVGDIDGWLGMKKFEIDVGHPVAIVDLDVLKNAESRLAVKRSLRAATYYAWQNIVQYRLKTPFLYWYAKTDSDAKHSQIAYYCMSIPPSQEARSEILSGLAPSLVSYALYCKDAGDSETLNTIARLIKDVSPESPMYEIISRIPELSKYRKSTH